MITINDQNNSHIIETVAEGKLSEQDYEKLIPILKTRLKSSEKLVGTLR